MENKYINDLKEINEIMNRSTRFISLSGLSGVSTGIIAIAGALLAYQIIFRDHDYLVYQAVNLNNESIEYLLMIAFGTLVLSIGAAIFFTTRETKKRNQKVWDHQTKRMLINLSIPLITGGLVCLMLLLKGYVGLILPLTLIFYGLALVHGSKYTLPELRNFGLIEILLGLIATQFINYSLVCWTIGFGLIQIIYGLIIQSKYKL